MIKTIIYGLVIAYVTRLAHSYAGYRKAKTEWDTALSLPDSDSTQQAVQLDKAKQNLSIAVFPFPKLYQDIFKK